MYLDSRLAAESFILFEAGSSTEAIRMPMADYMRTVQPSILNFAQEPRRRRRRVTRAMMWRRRATQAAPYAAAVITMLLGPRVMHREIAPVRTFALGLAAGAATSTLTEPQSGGRRRALLRDKPRRWMRQSTRRLDNRAKYLSGRARGLWHHTGGATARALAGRQDPSGAR